MLFNRIKWLAQGSRRRMHEKIRSCVLYNPNSLLFLESEILIGISLKCVIVSKRREIR